MLKNYELLYIIHPDLEGTSEKVTEKVAGFITKAGGEVTNQEDWGKRKLAYRIAKNDFGVYVLVNFNLESGKLPTIERDLRLSEEIMRSMIVVLPEIKAVKKSRSSKKAAAEKPVAKEEPVKEEKTETPVVEEVKEEAPVKKTRAKKAETTDKKPVKPAKKTKKTEEKEEKTENEAERMKKLDAKLDEILGE